MSVQVIGGVITCGPRDRTQWCVMMALANYADEFGFAFPSLETLAGDARCDQRTTRRQIVELERRGWIHVARKVHNGKSNVYQMNMERLRVPVSPMARRSPLFVRLLKRYAVAMTPIFAPEESEDTTTFSEDNPQGSQGTLAPTQRTNEGGSEDIACPPNRHNHQSLNRQEPSGEVEPLPPTPQGGRTVAEISTPAEKPLDPAFAVQWEMARLQLKQQLVATVPGQVERRFSEIRPGTPDWELCFRSWWLLGVTASAGGVVTFLTHAEDETATEAGIVKYRGRIERVLQVYFSLDKRATIRLVVQRPARQAVAA